MLRRSLAAITSATALLLLLSTTVLAGGWAEIRADATTADAPPVAGEPTEVGFTVLQHGQTPAGWVTPTARFTNAVTGQVVEVTAVAAGADGHFVATVTLPSGGLWSWAVSMPELITESLPMTMSVITADGSPPAFDQATTMAAIAQAIDGVRSEIDALRARGDALETRVVTLTQERDALETRVAAAEGDPGIPVPGFVLLSVLAGATAGFAMSWLGRRTTPDVRLISPSHGSEPV